MKKATAAVIFKMGKILIARRVKDGKWEFPGGKFEEGETPEQCIVREIKEELGLLIRVEKPLCVVRGTFRNQIMELFAFLVTPVSGELTPYIHQDVKWVSREELVTYNFLEEDKEIFKYLPH